LSGSPERSSGTTLDDNRVLTTYTNRAVVGAVEVAGGRLVLGAIRRPGPRQVVQDVHRWDVETGEPLPVFGEMAGGFTALAVSPDGRWIVGGGHEAARVWELGEDGGVREACRLAPDGWVNGAAVSAGGAVVATAGWDRVSVWDAETGSERFGFPKPRAQANGLAFARSHPILVSGGADRQVFVWDAASGVEIRRFAWDVGDITAVAFAPDGLRCAAAGSRGKVVVWDVDE
jgi:WD40 repeat protein